MTNVTNGLTNVIQLPTNPQTDSVRTVVEGTYTRIDSSSVDTLISGMLHSRGITHTKRLQHRVGTKSTKHCIVYTLTGAETLALAGDRVTPQIYVFNSYQKESAFMIAVGFLRWVCDNGMVVGENLFSRRVIHRTGPTLQQRVAEIEDGLAAALDYIESGELAALADELTALPLTSDQAISIAASLPIPKRVREQVMYAFSGLALRRYEDSADNLWTFWNTVNEYMRRSARSAVRNLERNTDILDHILALYEHETAVLDTSLEVVA